MKVIIVFYGGNRWNILGFNFTKRDALSSLYHSRTQSPSYARRDEGLWPNP
jgi:hypothetical protein